MWNSVCACLKKDLGDETYNNWISLLSLREQTETRAVLVAPTDFARDWIETHFRDVLMSAFRAVSPTIHTLELHVATDGASEPAIRDEASPSKTASHLDGQLTFNQFVVGKPNEFAYAAARRVAESCDVTFNPLFLHGPVGVGKTHLMHAVANYMREHQPKRTFLYLSAEKFMYHFIKALRSKDTMSFKDRFRSVDVLMIDDVQFISGKESTQEEFFHTFNALIDQKKQVILSADKSPSDLSGIEERVRSRMAWGLVADIHPATYELRLGILEAKAESMGHLPKEVLEFLAQKITSNIRELEGALTRVMAHATLVGRKMTIELAQDVLKDLLRACDRVVTVEDIQKRVAAYYNLRFSDLSSSKRSKNIAWARQVAMFLAKDLTTKSLQDIGHSFGGRDHTTVLYGVRKVADTLTSDSKIYEDIDLLRRMLHP